MVAKVATMPTTQDMDHSCKKCGLKISKPQNKWFDIFCFKKFLFFQKLGSYRPLILWSVMIV
jgi:hypothetical protein